MKYRGKGQKKILVIGEAPGAEEDKQNEQFVGKAGQRLEYELKRQGIDFNRDCWKTNAVRCRPVDNKTPNSDQIAACRPAVFDEIKQLKPQLILLFGLPAIESVIGHIWDSSGKVTIGKWLGWTIPNQQWNSWLSCNYHPSYLNRQDDKLLDLIFRKHLKKAVNKAKARPWPDGPPNYEEEIELLYKPRQIIQALKDSYKGIFSFDYEANCLKPEYTKAKIVSCSVCWKGKRTFAFPWYPEIMKAMSQLLRGPAKKIAANIKFENRWTQYVLGHPVRDWYWDTMLASHILNSIGGITGLKFQAFVRLGQLPYDQHIQPFLQSRNKDQHLNRISEIPLKKLLLYNGMDSRLEYEVALLQRKDMQRCR
jgi:uracil-DNA glycosylase family 4